MMSIVREIVWASPVPSLRWRRSDREFRDLARVLCPGDVAIDGGASLGLCAFRLAQAVGPAGRVIAFEPHPGSADRLERHLTLRGLGCVRVERLALSDVEGPRTLRTPIDTRGTAQPPLSTIAQDRATQWWGDGERAVAVQAVTLDAYADRHGIDRVAALKLDLEGGEFDALQGGARLIERSRPELLLEIESRHIERFGRTEEALYGLLRDLGYGRPRTVGGVERSVNRRFSPVGDRDEQ